MDADWEAHQGGLFERNLISERCPRGRRGPPAKGVSGQKPDRGFDNFVWNKIGQPKAGPERSEGRASGMMRAYPERNIGSPRRPLLHLLDTNRFGEMPERPKGLPC